MLHTFGYLTDELLRTVTGTKRIHHGLGGLVMSEELANDLHKPIRKNFPKCRVISNHVDDI